MIYNLIYIDKYIYLIYRTRLNLDLNYTINIDPYIICINISAYGLKLCSLSNII